MYVGSLTKRVFLIKKVYKERKQKSVRRNYREIAFSSIKKDSLDWLWFWLNEGSIHGMRLKKLHRKQGEII